MKLKLTVASSLLVFAALVVNAGENVQRKMQIEMIHSDGGEDTHFSIDSDDLGIDLMEMQVGENRSFVDKEGRTILMTREEDGITVNIDGKDLDIRLPALGDMQDSNVWVGNVHGEEVDVDVRHEKFVFKSGGEPGTLIVTEKEVDENTRQAIESLLQSAGHEGDVRFVDGLGDAHTARNVKVVRKVKEL